MANNDLTLCLDVGNSQLYAGLFDAEGELALRFRRSSAAAGSADEYGIFLKAAIRENGFDPARISGIAMCSVVPDSIYSIRRACQKYFDKDPFVLRAGVKTGLQIAYRNPLEVGADRIANAIAAWKRYPGRNSIIVDFGTATTLDVLTSDRRYLGGAIAPGLRISMEALEQRTARLPQVEIMRPQEACGRSTVESIQAGLFYGHLGMIKELTSRIQEQCFAGAAEPTVLLATGGFSQLFADLGLFDEVLPDLVLEGILGACELNKELQ